VTAPASAASTRSTRLPSALVLLTAASISALLLWSRRDYVPMFDGRFYTECIE
jgi:hypothetical protein